MTGDPDSCTQPAPLAAYVAGMVRVLTTERDFSGFGDSPEWHRLQGKIDHILLQYGMTLAQVKEAELRVTTFRGF